MTTIRPAVSADRAQLAATLASAFAEDPFFAWIAGVAPNAALEQKMRILFDALLRLDLAKGDHLVFADEDTIGVAVWKAPNQWKMPTGDLFRSLPGLLRAFGTKVPRAIGALNAIEKQHPKEEHYYLETVGTRQDMQSKGIGSALLGHMLDRCDT
jgi:GNAT superfamily N-acetyltransferase